MKFQQKLSEMSTPALLKIIKLGHPRFNSLSDRAILQCDSQSKRFQTSIQSVKMTAAKYGLVSLSSIQVGMPYNFFVMRDRIQYNKWYYKNTEPQEYEVYLNPEIIDKSELLEVQWEECASFPFQMYKVKRNEAIKVRYFNMEMNEKLEEFSCFKARVFQHEWDHLRGLTLASHEVSNGLFKESSRLQDLIQDNQMDIIEEEVEYLGAFEKKISINEQIIANIQKHHQQNEHGNTKPK